MFEDVVYQYDPNKHDHHIQTLYAIMKKNHIYTMSINLSSLKQTLPKGSKSNVFAQVSSGVLNENMFE